jgi:hypothetical protein
MENWHEPGGTCPTMSRVELSQAIETFTLPCLVLPPNVYTISHRMFEHMHEVLNIKETVYFTL